MHPRRSSSRSRDRDRDRRDEMDRGRRDDDRGHDYHEDRDRGRPDAKDKMPGWGGGQRDKRDSCGDDDWACGPRSGTGDGRGHSSAPRPSDGRQFETRATPRTGFPATFTATFTTDTPELISPQLYD